VKKLTIILGVVAAVSISINICLIFFILRHLVTGTSQPTHFGAFLEEGNSLVEMEQYEGGPRSLDSKGIPSTSSARPFIVLSYPEMNLDYLIMQSMDGKMEGRIAIEVSDGGEGSWRIRPKDNLELGVYCLVQGDPLMPPGEIPYWCLAIVGEVLSDESEVGGGATPNSTKQEVPPATATPIPYFLEVVPIEAYTTKTIWHGDYTEPADKGWQFLVVDLGVENIGSEITMGGKLESDWSRWLASNLGQASVETDQGYTYEVFAGPHEFVGSVEVAEARYIAKSRKADPYLRGIPPGFRSRLTVAFEVAETTSGYQLIIPEVGTYDLGSGLETHYVFPFANKPANAIGLGESFEIEPSVRISIRDIRRDPEQSETNRQVVQMQAEITNEGGYDYYSGSISFRVITPDGIWFDPDVFLYSEMPTVGPGQTENWVCAFSLPSSVKHITLAILPFRCEEQCNDRVAVVEIDL